jgi:tetratricopeptide (TPR) repeat protein
VWLTWFAVGVALNSGCHFQVARHTADGRSHLQNGQMTAAVDSFQQALMANPRDPDANYNLGATYYYLAKQTQQPYLNPKSEDLLRQAIALNPSHVDAYRTLAALYVETGRPNDAFQLIRGWQVGQPASPEPLIEMARLYREHGDGTRATQYLADALTLDPNHSRALVAMGTLREEQGNYDLALKNYTRSYQANSYQPEVAQRIAALQQRIQTDANPNSGSRYANPNMNSYLR